MAQLITKRHPYNPGYNLPPHVRVEPPGRGVIRTKGRPRRTIDTYAPYDKTYAIPDYVREEQPGRGVYYSKDFRRKTIPQLIPQYLSGWENVTGQNWARISGHKVPPPSVPMGLRADPSAAQYQTYLKGGAPESLVLSSEVYAMDGLGGDEKAAKNDAIRVMGQKVADFILTDIRKLQPAARGIAFQSLLDEMEPGLYGLVLERTEAYKKKGMTDKAAVRAAIASAVSGRYAKGALKMGQLSGLDGILNALNPVTHVKKLGEGAKAVGEAIGSAAKTTANAIVDAAKWTWNANKKLNQYICKASHGGLAQAAGGAFAAYYGVPPKAGADGVKKTAAACEKVWGKLDKGAGPEGQDVLVTPEGEVYDAQTGELLKKKFPVIPLAIGGAALLGVYLLIRRR